MAKTKTAARGKQKRKTVPVHGYTRKAQKGSKGKTRVSAYRRSAPK